MKNIKLLFLLVCILFFSCYNHLRQDGVLSYDNGLYPMVYFNSKSDVTPFIDEVKNTFGQPNGVDAKFEERLVWENLKNATIHNSPFKMVIHLRSYTNNGNDYINSVSIIVLDKYGNNLLLKNSEQQKKIKKYFQEIINRKVRQ